jgi:hypothetical protein
LIIWIGSIRFWIRFAAWCLTVIRSIIQSANSSQEDNETVPESQENNTPKSSFSTENAFPFSDVFCGEATERAKNVPRANTLGNALHWIAVVIIAVGLINVIFDSGGGGGQPKYMTKTEFRRTFAELPPHPDAYMSNDMDDYSGVELNRIVCELKDTDIYAAVGEPYRTQTIGDNGYMYWKCSDGLVQVITRLTFNNDKTGKLGICGINDY